MKRMSLSLNKVALKTAPTLSTLDATMARDEHCFIFSQVQRAKRICLYS
jgi:hypothetical protein